MDVCPICYHTYDHAPGCPHNAEDDTESQCEIVTSECEGCEGCGQDTPINELQQAGNPLLWLCQKCQRDNADELL